MDDSDNVSCSSREVVSYIKSDGGPYDDVFRDGVERLNRDGGDVQVPDPDPGNIDNFDLQAGSLGMSLADILRMLKFSGCRCKSCGRFWLGQEDDVCPAPRCVARQGDPSSGVASSVVDSSLSSQLAAALADVLALVGNKEYRPAPDQLRIANARLCLATWRRGSR